MVCAIVGLGLMGGSFALSMKNYFDEMVGYDLNPKHIKEALRIGLINREIEFEELEKVDAQIVCGDTKVVPKGAVDKVFINTTGIGEIIYKGISAHNLEIGDSVLVSRDIAKHGSVIMSHRYGVESDIVSDCKLLWPEVETLIKNGIKIKAIRDATRGGISAVLNEWSKASNVLIELEEDKIPIDDDVIGLCEIFGFEAMDLANEGTFVLAVANEDKEKALLILKVLLLIKH